MGFEVGNKVMVNGIEEKGVIVSWFFDEGSVWVVHFPKAGMLDCFEDEMTLIPS